MGKGVGTDVSNRVSPAAMIDIRKVRKVFPGGGEVLRDVTLEVPQGEICVLIGPSGCGKTTLLRSVNKLEPLTGGRILVDGKDIAAEDPVRLRRRIGYAIQQVGLFPNMTIGENIAVVPRLEDWPQDRIAARVTELLSLVGLPGEYAGRYPYMLSGGEAQRVGVARCLAADPPVLLLDEPFGALDPITRDRLREEFLGIQQRLRKTVLLVSHDMEEALQLGDRIALLRQGQVAQVGSPAAMLLNPASPFVREFFGGERAFAQLAALPIETVLGEAGLRESDPQQKPPPGSWDTPDSLMAVIRAGTSIREVLLALAEPGPGAGVGSRRARIVDATGQSLGAVNLGQIATLLAGRHLAGPPGGAG